MRIELSSLNEVDIVAKQVCAYLKEYNIAKETIMDIVLCVREGLNNAIIHGNNLDESKKAILELNVDSSIKFSITDCGENFDNASVQDELSENGRGLVIIKAILDEVEFKAGFMSGTLRLR